MRLQVLMIIIISFVAKLSRHKMCHAIYIEYWQKLTQRVLNENTLFAMDVIELYDIKCGCGYFGKCLQVFGWNDQNWTTYQSQYSDDMNEFCTEINGDQQNGDLPIFMQANINGQTVYDSHHHNSLVGDEHAVRRNDEFVNILGKHLLNMLASGFRLSLTLKLAVDGFDALVYRAKCVCVLVESVVRSLRRISHTHIQCKVHEYYACVQLTAWFLYFRSMCVFVYSTWLFGEPSYRRRCVLRPSLARYYG